MVVNKDSEDTSWTHPVSMVSVPAEKVGNTAVAIPRPLVVTSLSQQPLEDVAPATITKLEIISMDARADSRQWLETSLT